LPPAQPTVVIAEPEVLWQVNGAGSVFLKQLSPVEQHPTTVVCDDDDVYDGVHEVAEVAHE
jgi:hypothetical protein